ncbi:MAG: hypothetical protein M0P31_13850 [Solirubrobacteraceae bacterium]|nr:hypothetical protein [Solirubrobacteraceae bacterium]
MSRCRSCGAPIRWGITQSGRRIPLDPDPTPDGNVRLHPDGTAEVLSAYGLTVNAGPLHLSHFATCAQADQHRRTR